MPAAPSPRVPDPAGIVRVDVDWLRNELHVVGAAEAVARFCAEAAGCDVIPWTLDLDGLEEDFFLSMVTPAADERAISVAGARILARRLRDAVAANHQRALARRLTDCSCPFDLHRLLPIPDAILRLGPDDPAARAWLWAHWGTPRPLRHVRALPAAGDRRRRRTAMLRVEFWSADWSPWQALRRLRQAWPALRLDFCPDYPANGGG